MIADRDGMMLGLIVAAIMMLYQFIAVASDAFGQRSIESDRPSEETER